MIFAINGVNRSFDLPQTHTFCGPRERRSAAARGRLRRKPPSPRLTRANFVDVDGIIQIFAQNSISPDDPFKTREDL